MKWEVIHSETDSAQNHMDADFQLLQNIAHHPVLHFYDWDAPSATYGYFINPAQFLNLEKVEKYGLKLGKRPTGGGIVFHVADLAFSMLISSSHPYYSLNTLENYAYINRHVAKAVVQYKKGTTTTILPADMESMDGDCRHFCMAKPTIYDVMIEGKKIGGAAQRRTKEGFLHQGTISISLPEESFLEAILKPGTQVLSAMKSHSYVLEDSLSQLCLEEVRAELRQLLTQQFTLSLECGDLSPLC